MKRSFLKNAAILTVGGLIAKGMGAIYRIPLGNILGGYGMGLYQMAYPLFCMLLTFSSAGIPNAFARVIAKEGAEGRDSAMTVKGALKLFFALGVCGTLLMLFLAPIMARLQGELALANCYIALAPSVFFVAIIAVFRGYFQGRHDMRPTALSEIVEQLVKAGLGLAVCYLLRENIAHAVAGALLAVTISEVVALLWLLIRYRTEKGRYLVCGRAKVSGLFTAVLPVMASASLLPMSQMIDSVLIVRLLSSYTSRSVSLYGLFSGGACSLVNLPASISYGLAAASVPAVSEGCARNGDGGRRRALTALWLTLLVALPCALALFFFARPIVRILYASLSEEDGETLVSLIRVSSISAVTLSGVQTLSACLTGMGRAKRAALSMAIAIAVKTALQIVLVRDPAYSVMGAAIASNVCFIVAFFLDLYYTCRREKRKGANDDHRSQFGSRKGRLERARERGNFTRGQGRSKNGAYAVGGNAPRSGNSL